MSASLKRMLRKSLTRDSGNSMKGGAGRGGNGEAGGEWRLNRSPTFPHQMHAESVKRLTERERQELAKDTVGGLPGADKGDLLPGESQKATAEWRTVYIDPSGETLPGSFKNNSIRTSKYNVITFLPIFLFEMFRRAAYLYFLLQAGLSWVDEISPWSPLGATAALAFVLAVSAVKAGVEDYKRHAEDKVTNNTPTAVVTDLKTGEVEARKWREVKVGDIVKVKDGELFPADLMCLSTGLADNLCYIRTTNLDGESNLKIRKPVDLRGIPGFRDNEKETLKLPLSFRGHLESELPNRDLHRYKGRFKAVYKDDAGADKKAEVPVTMSEMLLRGTLLKNSRHVYGLVVYTGCDTRIQKNAATPPLKYGSFDRFLNIQVYGLIVIQALMCLLLAGGSLIWREEEGKKRYYLGLNEFVAGNYEDKATYFFLVFLTFWILTSYLVPISLFVTIEIVKFWQAFVFINNDPHMVVEGDETSHAHARNSNVNEDLGKVAYVFSDKTGTLTSNEMQLRMVAVKGNIFGDPDIRLEELGEEARGRQSLEAFDRRLSKAVEVLKNGNFWKSLINQGGSRAEVLRLAGGGPGMKSQKTMKSKAIQKELGGFADLEDGEELGSSDTPNSSFKIESHEVGDYVLGWHIVDFWTNICICHSLIIEETNDDKGRKKRVYQGPSPDEVALVEAGRQLGFEYCERGLTDVTLNLQDHQVKFDVLNVLEFSSDRKRMSVIARSHDGTIRLYSKGADNAIMERLQPNTDPDLLEKTKEDLHDFSVQGLRTLLLGTRVLSKEEWEQWDKEYQEAASSLDDRDAKILRVADVIERDLELVGITAIEDKLQEGVPMAIQTLRMADMKVWMITGDKMETAINIGVSCRLIGNQERVIILTADSEDEAKGNIVACKKEAESRLENDEAVELVVDGPSLKFILGKEHDGLILERELAELASLSGAVIVCRSSPSQKAAIVRVMDEFELRKAEGTGNFVSKWFRKQDKKIKSKSLAIGDGANDVAMIQAADVGVGIAGKEGRQAVNNSDYGISQFRFLVRLLLVHGQLSNYRLARLIKYSFFKNIAFAFVLIYFQIFCGFSGQTLVDDISATMYNVILTSMPILLFSLIDRPVSDASLVRFPQLYNTAHSLSTRVFWRTGILDGMIVAAMCFFIPFYAAVPAGRDSTHGLWAVGKTAFVALLGAVTLEISLVTRYWTKVYVVFVVISYGLIYPFFIIFPIGQRWFDVFDPAQYGVAENLFMTAIFWLTIIAVNAAAFGFRYVTRTYKWLYRPDDNMIVAEFESKNGALHGLEQDAAECERMMALGFGNVVKVENTDDSVVLVQDDPEDVSKGMNKGLQEGA
ncbi:unnamed protein product [Ostreobium quekettii]|uniref:Phospholipid-transporting ATPase n=1 Tax=Ostreobium quekettii TaxID=121088 RepID=A0A8S1J6J5_9CHLO|nr:unnamed protein product [Ostreobium quekettii]|eukprot:evm.model.scf_957.1 EVM.evm.TU.scf_957.1   scf_957:6743-20003(-)